LTSLFHLFSLLPILHRQLNLQKDNLALQEEITRMKKKMAEVTYTNNLYHVTLLEQNCYLPQQLFPHQISPPPTLTVPTVKKDPATNQLLEDHMTILLPMKEDPPKPPKKEANKTLKKELAWINKMSQVLAKLEKNFFVPEEKR
jgi:hypothetical protein